MNGSLGLQNSQLNTTATNTADNMLTLYLSLCVFVIGVASHALVFIFTFTKPQSSKNQVSIIIGSISLSEGLLCVYFGLWMPLMFATQIPMGADNAVFVGFILFGASDNCDVLLAYNRYVATCRPLQYDEIFSKKRTRLYIAAAWTIGSITSIPFSIPSCRLIVDYKMYHLTYEDKPCAHAFEYACMFFGTMALVALSFNLLTFRKLRTQSMQIAARARGDKEARRRAQREKAFFIQSVVTSTTTFFVVLFVDYLQLPYVNKWGQFFMTSFIPLILFSADGFIVVFLSKTIRGFILGPLRRAGFAKSTEDSPSRLTGAAGQGSQERRRSRIISIPNNAARVAARVAVVAPVQIEEGELNAKGK